MAKRRPLRHVGARKPDRHPVHNDRINFLDHYDEDAIERAKKYFLEKFNQAKAARSSRRNKWVDYYEMYRSYSSFYESQPEWLSSIYVPITHSHIETIFPREMDAFFSVPPLFTAIPAKPEYAAVAKQWEYYLDTRCSLMNIYESFHDILKESLIYGNSFAKLFYEVSDNYEGSDLVPTDIFDVYPDASARNIEGMRYIIHRTVVHIEELWAKQKNKLYQNVEKIKIGGGELLMNHIDRQQIVGFDGNDQQAVDREMHEVLEVWGRWIDFESYKDESKDFPEGFDVVMTIVDRKTVVRFEECPYVLPSDDGDIWYAIKPFIMFRNVPVPHELWGISEPEVLYSIQRLINDRYNQISDAVQLAISPVYQVQKNMLINDDIITFAPGSVIYTRQPDAISPLKRDLNFMSGFTDLSYMDRMAQNATGVFDPIAGRPAEITRKATEHMSYVDEAGVRINGRIKMHSHVSLPAMAKLLYALEKQYTREDVYARIMDSGQVSAYMKINPSALKYDGDWTLQVSSLYGQKGVIAKRRMQMIELAMELMQAGMVQFNMPRLARLAADALDIREKDIIIEQGAQPEERLPQKQLAEVLQMPGKRGNTMSTLGGMAAPKRSQQSEIDLESPEVRALANQLAESVGMSA